MDVPTPPEQTEKQLARINDTHPMIDLANEKPISFAEAATTLPRRRRGKKPHVATLYRWSKRGISGVRLETIQIGGTRCTSSEAMQRFFDSLGAKNATSTIPQADSKFRLRQIAAAEKETAENGI